MNKRMHLITKNEREKLSRQEPHRVSNERATHEWSYEGEGRGYGEMLEDGFDAVGEGGDIG